MPFSADLDINQNISANIKNISRVTTLIMPTIMPLVGLIIISLALVSYFTELPLSGIFSWFERFFSSAFIVIYSLLVASGIYAIVQLKQHKDANYWQEVGQQAGNAIATLALTFTLLGISLGIGTLAEQPLNPENVQEIIASLTKQFSMAFMTTVIGLPTATVIRALISIKYQKIVAKSDG
ncbi:hypothetical protein [Colwellia sp. TT2012]|uniref:hypothetical protein n=1 Tax=Colwellia sp. TT2012 TaxID=1720342 RepID=UPI00071120C5|nr:hypothetical protein [Colwellia sp. TT2012]